MVQTNMGLMTMQEEIIDVVPQTLKVKKKIAVDGIWEDRTFIRIPTGPERMGPGELEVWCRKNYGAARYLSPWFKVSGYIVLAEKTYVHWKLCE